MKLGEGGVCVLTEQFVKLPPQDSLDLLYVTVPSLLLYKQNTLAKYGQLFQEVLCCRSKVWYSLAKTKEVRDR